MEEICALCQKTIRELVEEQLKGRSILDGGVDVNFNSEIAWPFKICSTCTDFLRTVIPAIMVMEKLETE